MTTVETRKTLKFTKMCKHFGTKRCFMGNECNFAHSEEELRSRPNLAATGLCYQFMSKGHCRRGESCTFAHGKKELREIPEDVKETRDHAAVELRKSSRTAEASSPAHGALPALPLLPPLPLLPIDDLLLNAGLAVPMRLPPGLPPPVPTAASLASAAVAQAAHAAALAAAVSVLSTEQLKNFSFEPCMSPTTASLRSNMSEVGSEVSGEFDERLNNSAFGDLSDLEKAESSSVDGDVNVPNVPRAPPGLERDTAIFWL